MKFFAFWSYDTFPFCIWGELTKADETHFWVKGYEGFRFGNQCKIAFLPEAQAKLAIAKLEKLIVEKKIADANFNQAAKHLLESL